MPFCSMKKEFETEREALCKNLCYNKFNCLLEIKQGRRNLVSLPGGGIQLGGISYYYPPDISVLHFNANRNYRGKMQGAG